MNRLSELNKFRNTPRPDFIEWVEENFKSGKPFPKLDYFQSQLLESIIKNPKSRITLSPKLKGHTASLAFIDEVDEYIETGNQSDAIKRLKERANAYDAYNNQ